MPPRDPRAFDRLIIGLTWAVMALGTLLAIGVVYAVVRVVAGWP